MFLFLDIQLGIVKSGFYPVCASLNDEQLEGYGELLLVTRAGTNRPGRHVGTRSTVPVEISPQNSPERYIRQITFFLVTRKDNGRYIAVFLTDIRPKNSVIVLLRRISKLSRINFIKLPDPLIKL